MTTQTGGFPIGFRRLRSEWQHRDLPAVAAWAKSAGFEAMDLAWATHADIATVRAAGLQLGSVDLLDFGSLLDADPGKRGENVERNVAYVKEMGELGARIFLTVMLPGEPQRKRSENHAVAVEAYGPIVEAIRSIGGSLVLEGWPGAAPYYAALGCTPESCRALIRDLGDTVAINYDPSHLIRQGIDPLRFLNEFLPHVRHVHAKDTLLLAEARYQLGRYQNSLTTQPHGYGEHVWRYTLPGRGEMNWGEAFKTLARGGYRGLVSVELEDEEFNGSEAGERAGLLQSLEFLSRA